MYVLLVIRYVSGIVRWTKEDMKVADINARKLLVMYGNISAR